MLMAAALSGVSEAAQSCWSVTGWTTASGSNTEIATLFQKTCVQDGSSTQGWLQSADLFGLASEDIWLLISSSDSHMINNRFHGTPNYVGDDSNGEPIIELEIIFGGSNQYDLDPQAPNPCGPRASWWDGSLRAGSFDTQNCYVQDIPSGETGFIYNNAFYLVPDPTPVCDVGSYDSANCYVGALPEGSTPYLFDGNYLMVTYQAGGGCGIGYNFPWGGGCFIGEISPHATPFTWSGNLYTTAIPTCTDGDYDGLNCYLGTAPATRTAFLWPDSSGAFYFGH